jgi:hypothetical protein
MAGFKNPLPRIFIKLLTLKRGIPAGRDVPIGRHTKAEPTLTWNSQIPYALINTFSKKNVISSAGSRFIVLNKTRIDGVRGFCNIEVYSK